jgi:hypothetical protein
MAIKSIMATLIVMKWWETKRAIAMAARAMAKATRVAGKQQQRGRFWQGWLVNNGDEGGGNSNSNNVGNGDGNKACRQQKGKGQGQQG